MRIEPPSGLGLANPALANPALLMTGRACFVSLTQLTGLSMHMLHACHMIHAT